MLSESHPRLRRLLRFLALPYCYFFLVNWKECTASKIQVAKDLLYIFFVLKYYPDNYSPCRFWEKERSAWNYYYGSSYDPYQRGRLRKQVQPFEYLILFDDKEICNLLCRGIDKVAVPDYYGVISHDMDYKKLLDNLLLSSGHERLIVKPVNGSAGQGISMVVRNYGDTTVRSGSAECDLDDFVLLDRSIVQSVIKQSEEIARISPGSVNTIRVVTLYTVDGEAIIISASMRFGVGNAFIDNWSAGGIAVGVDHANGMLRNIAYDKNGKQYRSHPVSNIYFEGLQLPHWPAVIEMATAVQKACPFFKLLGLDVALTVNGPVLVEVNPSTDIIFQEQTAGPLLSDINTWRQFKKYNLLVNKYQEQLY